MTRGNRTVACSRRSDTGARAKNKAGVQIVERERKIFFARARLSERLEQANRTDDKEVILSKCPHISALFA